MLKMKVLNPEMRINPEVIHPCVEYYLDVDWLLRPGCLNTCRVNAVSRNKGHLMVKEEDLVIIVR